MNVVIVEDEKPAARRLERMLIKLDMNVIALLHSVESAINWFDTNAHPDIIFLDIQLSDGLSFEIFEEIEIQSAIIFTTAYDEYALKAFKLNSIDYLLKPIDDEELSTAIRKYSDLKKQQSSVKINELKALLQPTISTYKSRFSVKIGQHIKLIPVQSIECFYSENKSTYIYTNNKRSYLVDMPLEQLTGLLNPALFYRVNRTYFVNINYIHDIISYTNSRLQLKLDAYTEEAIIVSRERVRDFKKWLDS
ncbi:MAG: response regulator transcription factor [Flavobacteriaceae bacterium]|nr:response regulator transcription factor [Flavobacteriaceae bacterium]